MSDVTDRLKEFVKYAKPLGDEKGEAQVFCDRLFQAFGHDGYKAVAKAAVDLRTTRTDLMSKHGRSLRELYRTLELPGDNPLKTAHAKLNTAVRSAYGMSPKADPLQFLLALNAAVIDAEAKGDFVQPPGLPASVKNRSQFVTSDRITV